MRATRSTVARLTNLVRRSSQEVELRPQQHAALVAAPVGNERIELGRGDSRHDVGGVVVRRRDPCRHALGRCPLCAPRGTARARPASWRGYRWHKPRRRSCRTRRLTLPIRLWTMPRFVRTAWRSSRSSGASRQIAHFVRRGRVAGVGVEGEALKEARPRAPWGERSTASGIRLVEARSPHPRYSRNSTIVFEESSTLGQRSEGRRILASTSKDIAERPRRPPRARHPRSS